MKKIILLLTLCLLAVDTYGQSNKTHTIGTHVAFGTGWYGFGTLGGGSYDVKYYYSIGLDYAKQLSKRWDFCTGMEYTYNKMMVTPSFTGDEVERVPHKTNLTLITIPAQFKYHFGKLVYLNGGMFVNVLARSSEEAWVPSRSGAYKSTHNVGMLLGVGLGIGFEHEFSSGILLSLNPYIRWNGFGGLGNFQTASDQLFLQGGVRLGVGYRF